MTTKQMIAKLKSAGFDTQTIKNIIVVSLNRPISTMEVNAVFDNDIPQEFLAKAGDAVIIL